MARWPFYTGDSLWSFFNILKLHETAGLQKNKTCDHTDEHFIADSGFLLNYIEEARICNKMHKRFIIALQQPKVNLIKYRINSDH